MLAAEPMLCYTAICRGDLDTLEAFVTRRLEGHFAVLSRADGEALAEMRVPARWQKTAECLHDTMIRDEDGGCCWVAGLARAPT